VAVWPTESGRATSSSTIGPTTDRSDAEHEPSPAGLCHARGAGNKTEHGKALDSRAFTALIHTAGDKAKVDGLCTTLFTEEAARPGTPPAQRNRPSAPAT